MTTSSIVPRFVASFPQPLESGVLYVSVEFSTASHLCACGCGREIVTPLSRGQWVLTFDGSVSLWPSIGNWALPCRSHYVIDRGTIRWERTFASDEARAGRARDHRLRDDDIGAGGGLRSRMRRGRKIQ